MSCLSKNFINSIITQNGFNIKKNLGQNFLCDENILEKIVDFSMVENDDFVLEIGPGLGALTDLLIKKAKKVIAIEIDKGLCKILREKYKEVDNFCLIEGDFLDITKDENINVLTKYFDDNKKIKCVANLPYYITSPIIMKLLSMNMISELTIMVQKEVGERIFAKESTKDYGILTLAIQYYSTPYDKFIVSKECFYPKPKVDSMVIKLIKNKNYDANEKFLFKIIKDSFSQRRKKLINSLSSTSGIKKEAIKASLSKINQDENVRAENLSLKDYITLSPLLEKI